MGVRISIVRSDSCKELRFRHEKKLDCSDFILLYNCCPGNSGHYSAVMCTDKLMIIASSLKRFRNFNYELDLRERETKGGGGIRFSGVWGLCDDKVRRIKANKVQGKAV